MLQRLIEFSLQHRLIVILSIIVLVFLGVSALTTSPAEFLPDLNSPIISVLIERPGLAPQEVENLITRPLENNLQLAQRRERALLFDQRAGGRHG